MLLYLENIPLDDAPITSLWIELLSISSAIALATSSDSITTTSTCTYIHNCAKLAIFFHRIDSILLRVNIVVGPNLIKV